MWWIIGYIVIALITIPLLGRSCAASYRQKPRRYDQVSPVTFGIVWGSAWPIILISGVFYYGHEGLVKIKIPNLVRKVVTGTSERF